MPIEKVFVRILLGIGMIFLILTVCFYPLSYSFSLVAFMLILFIADRLIPLREEDTMKKWEISARHIVIILLVLSTLMVIFGIFMLWKLGCFN